MESLTFNALGGECELYGIDIDAAALEQGQGWTLRMHDRFTRFEPNSELSRLNASSGKWVTVTAELEALLRASLRAFEISDGLVNIAVLPALLAAGYTRDFAARPTASTAAPRIRPLPEVLQLRPGEARLADGAALDLGGIAKGWLADRLARDLGDNVLVNLCAGGHHLIDPRTGLPAQTDLSEVSVLATTATDAEIYAKVALLLGARAAPRWLEGRSQGWSLT